MIKRPDIVDDGHLIYLDNLRESGVTNMFGAGEYLEKVYTITKHDAKIILMYWMRSFEERHPR